MKKKVPLRPMTLPEGWKPERASYKEQWFIGEPPYPKPQRVMEVAPVIFWLLVTLVVTDTLFNLIFAYFLFSVSLR